MKKCLLFLLLLNHINTTLFFPVIENPVVQNGMGYYDETNSVIEWFQKEVMGHKSSTIDDEDDDHPICLLVKSISYAAYTESQDILKFSLGAGMADVSISATVYSQLQKGFLSRFSPPPDFV